MELANLEDTKERTHQLKMEEQQREEGDEVTLWLSLPGRRMESIKFKLGVTVAYAKLVIQKQFELEGTITLKMEKVLPTGEVLPTTILIDPLSLGDFPGIRAGMAAGEDIKIVVECS